MKIWLVWGRARQREKKKVSLKRPFTRNNIEEEDELENYLSFDHHAFSSINIQFLLPIIVVGGSSRWSLTNGEKRGRARRQGRRGGGGWTFFSRWGMSGIIFLRIPRNNFTPVHFVPLNLVNAALPLSSLFYTLSENVLNPLPLDLPPFPPPVPHPLFPEPSFLPAREEGWPESRRQKVPTLSVSDVTLLFLLYCA